MRPMISVVFMGLVAYGQTQDTHQGTLNGVFWMVMSQGEELMFVQWLDTVPR
jgi:hypothetical protein